VHATHNKEKISEKRDGRRREPEIGKFRVNRFLTTSEIGVSMTKKRINHQIIMIFQIDCAKKSFH
jgi:hypothetical protein